MNTISSQENTINNTNNVPIHKTLGAPVAPYKFNRERAEVRNFTIPRLLHECYDCGYYVLMSRLCLRIAMTP